MDVKLKDEEACKIDLNSLAQIRSQLPGIAEEIITTHLPKEITVNYIGESLYGETVTSLTQILEANPSHTFLHSIINNNTQKEITRLKTVWDRFE